jgi:hypothetical protein
MKSQDLAGVNLIIVKDEKYRVVMNNIPFGGGAGSVVVKTLSYKPECRGFETR